MGFLPEFFKGEIKIAKSLGKKEESEWRALRPRSSLKICNASAFSNVHLLWEKAN
jgi:hypothetical protein